MRDRYSFILYLIPTNSALKTPLKPQNCIHRSLYFSKQNGVGVKVSNIIRSSQRHNACSVFVNTNVNAMINQGCKLSLMMSIKQIRAFFKYCQFKTHVQTARESHDLNMDFRSFDNGFKHFCGKFYV